MNRPIDPQYQFTFTTEDGRRYTKSCYWEARYVFAYGTSRILAAARVVPFSNVHEALYTAFQSERGEQLTWHLLPEAIGKAPTGIQSRDAFVENIAALAPDRPSQLPEEILEKAEEELEETASRELIRSGIENGLSSFDDAAPFPGQNELSRPGDADAEARLIRLSFRVDEALKAKMRDFLQADASSQSLVRDADFEFDIARRLYSNPRYLGFVRRLLHTKDSYLSPVVRDFVSFYTRCLNMRLREVGRENHVAPDVLARRVEGILGREKGKSHHFLDYYEVTILGAVIKGELEPDARDPDYTGERHFKLSEEIDSEGVLLREIEDRIQRFLFRKFVGHIFNAHHNVKRVQFLDETEAPKPPERRLMPDGVERVLHRAIDAVETWSGAHSGNLLKTAVMGLLVAVLLCSLIVVAALVKIAGQ